MMSSRSPSLMRSSRVNPTEGQGPSSFGINSVEHVSPTQQGETGTKASVMTSSGVIKHYIVREGSDGPVAMDLAVGQRMGRYHSRTKYNADGSREPNFWDYPACQLEDHDCHRHANQAQCNAKALEIKHDLFMSLTPDSSMISESLDEVSLMHQASCANE